MKKLFMAILLLAAIQSNGQNSPKNGKVTTLLVDTGYSSMPFCAIPMLNRKDSFFAKIEYLKGYTIKDGKDSIASLLKDTLGVMPIIDNRLSSEFYFYYNPRPIIDGKPLTKWYLDSTIRFSIQPYKQSFHIDSTDLQLIIQELERHGYELPKIKKIDSTRKVGYLKTKGYPPHSLDSIISTKKDTDTIPTPVLTYKSYDTNIYAPSVSKTNKGDFIVRTDSLTAIKQLWDEIIRREKEHQKTINQIDKLFKKN